MAISEAGSSVDSCAMGSLFADLYAILGLSANAPLAGGFAGSHRRSAGLPRSIAWLACGEFRQSFVACPPVPRHWLGTSDTGLGMVRSTRFGHCAACFNAPARVCAMNPWIQLTGLWVLAALMMSLGWLWQRSRANAGIVDVLWAGGTGMSAILLAMLGEGAASARMILAVLGGLWGARLAAHIWTRVRGEPEDGRYRNLRAHWNGSQFKF